LGMLGVLSYRDILSGYKQRANEHHETIAISLNKKNVENAGARKENTVPDGFIRCGFITKSFTLSNNELQVSNENPEQFAYIASHDLQEPLRKISTFSAILQDQYIKELPEAVKGLLDTCFISSYSPLQYLQNCTHNIKKITSEEAVKKYKRKPCNWCYK
jgi:signal transduction histidine kinase